MDTHRRYQLVYTDTEGNTVSVTWQLDGAEHFTDAARSVMLAAGYLPATVDEYIPDTYRSWAYTDKEQDNDDSGNL